MARIITGSIQVWDLRNMETAAKFQRAVINCLPGDMELAEISIPLLTRAQVMAAAHSFLGVRYRHQHSDRRIGMDCIGLICAVARAVGYADYRPPPYRVNPDPDLFVGLLRENFKEIPLAEIKPGDIFCMDYGNGIQHVGILIENNQIIHSEMQFKCVAKHDLDPAWRAKMDKAKVAFTWRGIAS